MVAGDKDRAQYCLTSCGGHYSWEQHTVAGTAVPRGMTDLLALLELADSVH